MVKITIAGDLSVRRKETIDQRRTLEVGHEVGDRLAADGKSVPDSELEKWKSAREAVHESPSSETPEAAEPENSETEQSDDDEETPTESPAKRVLKCFVQFDDADIERPKDHREHGDGGGHGRKRRRHSEPEPAEWVSPHEEGLLVA